MLFRSHAFLGAGWLAHAGEIETIARLVTHAAARGIEVVEIVKGGEAVRVCAKMRRRSVGGDHASERLRSGIFRGARSVAVDVPRFCRRGTIQMELLWLRLQAFALPLLVRSGRKHIGTGK